MLGRPLIESEDQDRIAVYYDRLVDRYGHDPQACDASSADSLNLRYQCLAEITDLSGKSVLEVGCGFGDLGAYLIQKYERVQYAGIDISSRMIEEGRRAYPGLHLERENVLEIKAAGRFDVVLAQGIFYLLGNDAEAKMYRLIEKMFSLAREAVGFSTISSWSPNKDSGEFYADPAKLLEWCRKLTPWLALRHDYHQGDFTMFLYKNRTQLQLVNGS